eukprot:TRINITY_DN15892_c0_g1_i3.p1 TRINITY_DN15892_c0_g1~~TRINITY_DN15892_c0_g1_i3.p1  ORF type:complete len:569 (-),score=88.09 TRINITY_DN15892_c0_g1_i3:92-1798(-)
MKLLNNAGVEFGERMTYFGISSNLIIYLTSVMHLGVKMAAKEVNNWTGVTTCVPLVGGFLADAYFGRYWMVLISTVIYLLGLILLTLTVSLKDMKPRECSKRDAACLNDPHPSSPLQHALFFVALYLIAVGTGGHKPSLQSFGADQFSEEDAEERRKKASFFNWWYCGLSAGVLLGVTVVVYVEDNVSWTIGFAIPTAVMLLALFIFVAGTPVYRTIIPRGSPLTKILQVFTASFLNKSSGLGPQATVLHEEWDVSPSDSQGLLSHTESLRFFDRAAMVEKGAQNIKERNPWQLCTVTQVEETKLVVRLIPVWLCCLIYGTGLAQGHTFFIKQGATLNRKLGPHFTLPSATLLAPTALAMVFLSPVYDRVFVPMARKITGKERGITLLQRIGTGMFFMVVCMASAALTEIRRLSKAKSEGLLDDPKSVIPISVFWMLPQFLLLGTADLFTLVGLQEFFYEQVPDDMRSMGIALYLSVIGVGSFLSSVLITIIDKVSSLGNANESWFQSNLNKCHLDYFYWVLAGLNFLNLCGFVYIARRFPYKRVRPKGSMEMIVSQGKENDEFLNTV